jgi:hypothetical protein
MRRFVPLILPLCLFACQPYADTANAENSPSEEASTSTHRPEDQCDDEFDDDGDGLIDCDDSDCDDIGRCAWPETVETLVHVDFEPQTIAEVMGYGPCKLQMTTSADEDDTASDCFECDQTYTGRVHYELDTCPQDVAERPFNASFGLTFLSKKKWEVWMDVSGEGEWTDGGVAERNDDGVYFAEASEVVDFNGVNVGTLHVKAWIRDADK